jgi:hypothetical protein
VAKSLTDDMTPEQIDEMIADYFQLGRRDEAFAMMREKICRPAKIIITNNRIEIPDSLNIGSADCHVTGLVLRINGCHIQSSQWPFKIEQDGDGCVHINIDGYDIRALPDAFRYGFGLSPPQSFQGLADPSVGGGAVAVVGSLYMQADGTSYVKTGPGATEWTRLNSDPDPTTTGQDNDGNEP